MFSSLTAMLVASKRPMTMGSAVLLERSLRTTTVESVCWSITRPTIFISRTMILPPWLAELDLRLHLAKGKNLLDNSRKRPMLAFNQ